MALTAADLSGMRATLDTSLPDTCTVRSRTPATDSAGGYTQTSSDTTVACRVSPLATAGRDFEATDGERITSSVPWVITLPSGSIVGPSDRILHSGDTYEVVASGTRHSYEIDVRLICRKVS